MEIRLRRLQEKDAEGMYEWMTDPEITCFFRFDASSVSLQTCKDYIKHAYDDLNSMHYAIADENDEYLGTISLKNITDKDAEYAISTRKKAHGMGAAYKATLEILRIAFEEYKLEKVYLNVLADNKRADRFYQKCGFSQYCSENDHIYINGKYKRLNWYVFNKNDFISFMMKESVTDNERV